MICSILLSLALAGLTLFAAPASQPDGGDGHQLSALWKTYQAAVKADLPQKEAEVLQAIKKEAVQKHLPVDFYDAATLYVSTVTRRDWKQREPLLQALEQEVKDFGEPVVTFAWMGEWQGAGITDMLEYAQDHAGRMQDKHPAMHRGVDSFLQGSLKPFIRSDYEWALWYLTAREYHAQAPAQAALEQEVAGIYPNEAVLEFYREGLKNYPENRRSEEIKAYENLAAKYAGKAFSLYPRAALLRLRFQQLKSAGEAESLYRDAQALEGERKAFTGADKTLTAGCTYPASLLETLTEKSLSIRFTGKQAEVLFRNLQTADIILRQEKKTVKTWKAVPSAGSFYVQDTVRLALPALPDGDYTLEAVSGKASAQDSYAQYTLSVATCTDSRGPCVYVADYETGVPLRNVTLHLRKSGREVAVSTLKLDGFTPLPAALTRQLKGTKENWEVVAENGSRSSRGVFLNRAYTPKSSEVKEHCLFYKDRGAYNPGDTLRFKLIVFKGEPSGEMEVVKGRQVTVRLRDAQDKTLQSLEVETGAWGAACGVFALPKGLRNGFFTLEAAGLGSERFRVDEFVLPSFGLVFEKDAESLQLPGSPVPIQGRLVSYSGHNLTGARVRVKVDRYGSAVLEQELSLADDGHFQGSFIPPMSGYYTAEVTVTEAGGETRAFSTAWSIGDKLGVEARVLNEADAEIVAAKEPKGWPRQPACVIAGKEAQLQLQALGGGGNPLSLPVNYVLTDGKKQVASGKSESGAALQLQLPHEGLFLLETRVEAPDTTAAAEKSFRLFCLPEGSRTLGEGTRRVLISGPEALEPRQPVRVRLGSGEGDAWAVASLYGEGRQLLEMKTVHVADGKIEPLSFKYKDAYPDAVCLRLFYFIHGEAVSYSREFRRAKDKFTLPLHCTRFQDKAYPGTQYSFSVKTQPGVEALAAVWDKSLDAVAPNTWPLVSARDISVDWVYVSTACGRVGGYSRPEMYLRVNQAKAAAVDGDAVVLGSEALEDVAVPVREVFSTALTFQPQLYPAADGTLDVQFNTGDKLSTFYVRVFAHDRAMRNAAVEREMVVTLPVKVSLLEPRYLYAGDRYNAVVTLSSTASEPVSGTLSLRVNDRLQEVPVTVPAGKTVTHRFEICHSERSEESLTATFRSEDFSDAIRVKVPVYPASQPLTEAHSAVLREGMDPKALLEELQGRFVNVPAVAAQLSELTLLDLVQQAVPQHVEPAGDDVLSLSEAWYVQQLCHAEPAEAPLLPRILACQNADGGFGWFEGMRSSPVITAVLLERFARLRDRGLAVPDVTAAVRYLDKEQFSSGRAAWQGGISDQQYMYVRALYAAVPFEVSAVTKAEKKRLKQFAKDGKAYLLPPKKAGRGLEGQILAKARRLLTLRSLLEREGGTALVKAWGVSLGTSAKLQASISADLASLREYAVQHRDGGMYYPNAVLPWRGLLESEAYAHALLCELLGNDPIADGIRLWLMLQKETQHWDASPAFVDAITAVLNGSPAVLNTRIVVLQGSGEVPFNQVQASGNGFSIERKLYRDGVPVGPGEVLKVGDRIQAEYKIWSAENRSFVKLTVPREAALSPVQQLSGPTGYFGWRMQPQGYRNVKAAATEYYFETYPEESTTLSEEFFVVREGVFQAPVPVIESLYAPHYRACGEGGGTLAAE